jgi:glutamate/tyrosine decarboxylase-like PLP-dependent enzyme
MNELLQDAARRAATYLEGLDARAVAPDPAAVAALSALDIPMPAVGTPDAAVLAELDRLGSPATMAMAGPRFFGFVIGGSLPVTVAANWLATAWDQNAALSNVTPSASRFEQVALRWLIDLFGLPRETAGAFVTGATVANFVALAAARHAVLARAGWSVEADGLFGAPPITVVVGEEVHASVVKALGMLGLGRNRLVRAPADDQGRIRPERMPAIAGPTIVLVQAGNVNSGAIDAIGEVCARVRGTGAWVHVDGAFGLWAAASPELSRLTPGIGDADSWATDAHKWLNVPYDSGLAFVRDEAALLASMAITTDYLPTESDFRNPADYTPELSRRARGVDVWAALRGLGRKGLAEMLERNCRQARRFAEGLRASGYRVLNEIALNQVLVAFGDAATTLRVIAALQAEGTCWCGSTVWRGHTAMRISVSSWATTDADVEKSLDAMLRVAAECGAAREGGAR